MPFFSKLIAALFGRGSDLDKSGQWWKGATPGSIREYLDRYMADSYPMHEFRLARCDCGSDRFRLDADDCEGVARRTCTDCAESRFICGSEQYAEEAELEHWMCADCESDVCNAGVGFSIPNNGKWVRWLDVGVRCDNCGILGCFVGWDADGTPAAELLGKV